MTEPSDPSRRSRPAIHYAGRLERLCREPGQKVVLSSAVAAHLGDGVRSAGLHALRSIAQPQEAFVPV